MADAKQNRNYSVGGGVWQGAKYATAALRAAALLPSGGTAIGLVALQEDTGDFYRVTAVAAPVPPADFGLATWSLIDSTAVPVEMALSTDQIGEAGRIVATQAGAGALIIFAAGAIPANIIVDRVTFLVGVGLAGVATLAQADDGTAIAILASTLNTGHFFPNTGRNSLAPIAVPVTLTNDLTLTLTTAATVTVIIDFRRFV